MSSSMLKPALLLAAGFALGIGASHLPQAHAASAPAPDLAHTHFQVSIDEVRQNFVFAGDFSGRYVKDVTLSDGTRRHIELTPMVHDGIKVVQFKDNHGLTYMSLDGTTTNGKLMVQLQDMETMKMLSKRDHWPFHFN